MRVKERSVRGRAAQADGPDVSEYIPSEGGGVPETRHRETPRQDREPRDAGESSASSGYADKVRVARTLALKFRLDYVELEEGSVDMVAAGIVDRRVLRKHGALPFRMEDGWLHVAVADPSNLHAIEDLSMLSGYRVRPVVATDENIERVSNRVFAVGEDVKSILLGDGEDRGSTGPVGVELGGGSPEDGPVVRIVGSILQSSVGDGASDIHVEPRAGELRVRHRVDGVLRDLMAVPSRFQGGIIARLKVLADLDIAERRLPQDGRLSVRLGAQTVELRVATLPTVFGEKVVLRLLDAQNVEVDLRRLGISARMLRGYDEVFRRPHGTVLVTGPTGCGKSTTLYATLGELNGVETNIVTIEDPVEYRMPGVNQMQVNPKVGLGFASGLRSILRADPDVVMIGEIRDRETARTSIEAALTGHLVFARFA